MPVGKKKIGLVQIGPVPGATEPYVAVIEVGVGGFAHEVSRAIERGENPAKALLFLADLAVRHCNPHHTQLSPHEVDVWKKYFG